VGKTEGGEKKKEKGRATRSFCFAAKHEDSQNQSTATQI
jgi:hypothetical protein